jgi:hypothetical protein
MIRNLPLLLKRILCELGNANPESVETISPYPCCNHKSCEIRSGAEKRSMARHSR